MDSDILKELDAISTAEPISVDGNEPQDNVEVTENTEDNKGAVEDSESVNKESDTTKEEGTKEVSEKPASSETYRFASEKVAKYNDFVRKTGKEDYSEFEFWEKGVDNISEDDLLRRYLSEKEKMSADEIDDEMEKMELPDTEADDFDEDFFDEDEYSEKEALRNKTLKKAKEWHNEEYSKISSMEGSDIPKYMSAEEYDNLVMENRNKVQKENLEHLYKTLPNISGISLKTLSDINNDIEGIEVDYAPDEVFKSDLKRVSEDIGVAVNQYFEEDGSGRLRDPRGWAELSAWAYPPTRNKLINHIVTQAILKDRVARSNRQRNVTTDNYQAVSDGSPNDESAFLEWFSRSR